MKLEGNYNLGIYAGKNLKPYQGLKQTIKLPLTVGGNPSRKKPKTLSGIETLGQKRPGRPGAPLEPEKT